MNVLCLGYFDKFSRFFKKIENELNYDKPIKFKFFNLYLSGCLYHWVRLTPSSWISVWAWINVFLNKKKYYSVIKNRNSYKGVFFENFIKFHTSLKPAVSKHHLLLQTISYIDIFQNVINRFHPTTLLVIGDSRLAIEIAIVLAKRNNIKIHYIEQGPFNTTILDNKGVNANASIRGYNNSENTINLSDLNSKLMTKKRKYNRSPIYRSLDYILEFIFNKTVLFPPDLKSFYNWSIKSINLKNLQKKSISEETVKGKKVFLLILQIPFDVNMIYHSPNYKDHCSIVKDVFKNLPLDCILVVKEHPIYRNKYDEKLYRFISDNPIYFDLGNNINKSLNNSDVVIVNNSTVGIEAIAKLKPVVVLGNSYYDSSNICIKYNNDYPLKDTLEKALKYNVDENAVNSFLYNYFQNYSIKGNIIDNNLQSATQIAQKII